MQSSGEYPDNWEDIARRLKELVGWKCEHCGHPHDPASGYVLTVHHLDMNPANCNFTNIVALCQRCHLRIQAQYKPGQLFLFEVPRWAAVRSLDKQEYKNDDLNEQMNEILGV